MVPTSGRVLVGDGEASAEYDERVTASSAYTHTANVMSSATAQPQQQQHSDHVATAATAAGDDDDDDEGDDAHVQVVEMVPADGSTSAVLHAYSARAAQHAQPQPQPQPHTLRAASTYAADGSAHALRSNTDDEYVRDAVHDGDRGSDDMHAQSLSQQQQQQQQAGVYEQPLASGAQQKRRSLVRSAVSSLAGLVRRRRAAAGAADDDADTAEPIDESEQERIIREIEEQNEAQNRRFFMVFLCMAVAGALFFAYTGLTQLHRPGSLLRGWLAGTLPPVATAALFLVSSAALAADAHYMWVCVRARANPTRARRIALASACVSALLWAVATLLAREPSVHALWTGLGAPLLTGLSMYVEITANTMVSRITGLRVMKYAYKQL